MGCVQKSMRIPNNVIDTVISFVSQSIDLHNEAGLTRLPLLIS